MSKTYELKLNGSNVYQSWLSSLLNGKIIKMLLRWWNTQERDNLSSSKAVMYILSLGRDVNPSCLQSVALTQKSRLPDTSGIYFAIAKSQILYIGRAQNIRQRWTSHHRYDQLRKLTGVRLHWIRCDSRLLPKAEIECIKRFKPCLNYQLTATSTEPRKAKSTPKDDYRYHLVESPPCSRCDLPLLEKTPVHYKELHYYNVICACCGYHYKSEAHPKYQAALDEIRAKTNFLLKCNLVENHREILEWIEQTEPFSMEYNFIQKLYKKYSGASN